MRSGSARKPTNDLAAATRCYSQRWPSRCSLLLFFSIIRSFFDGGADPLIDTAPAAAPAAPARVDLPEEFDPPSLFAPAEPEPVALEPDLPSADFSESAGSFFAPEEFSALLQTGLPIARTAEEQGAIDEALSQSMAQNVVVLASPRPESSESEDSSESSTAVDSPTTTELAIARLEGMRDGLLSESAPEADAPEPPPEEYVALPPGTLLPSILRTSVDSDFGNAIWTAAVARDVPFPDGSTAVPRGSVLIGAVAQFNDPNGILRRRVALVARSLTLPSGETVALGSGALDRGGRPGLTGEHDSRFWPRTLGATAFAILSIGPALALDNGEAQSSRDDATRAATQDISQSFQPLARRYSQLSPRNTLAPGTRFHLLLDQPLFLPPAANPPGPLGSEVFR